MHPGIDHDGRHDQHPGFACPHRQLLCPCHQTGQPVGNVLGGGGITLLAVVGAQHHHQEVQRTVSVQRRGQVCKAAEAFVQRVLKHSGAAAHPFLRHQIAFAQLLLQKTGPAHVVLIAAAGGGAVAPGVGIAVAYNVFSVHGCSTAFSHCFLPPIVAEPGTQNNARGQNSSIIHPGEVPVLGHVVPVVLFLYESIVSPKIPLLLRFAR